MWEFLRSNNIPAIRIHFIVYAAWIIIICKFLVKITEQISNFQLCLFESDICPGEGWLYWSEWTGNHSHPWIQFSLCTYPPLCPPSLSVPETQPAGNKILNSTVRELHYFFGSARSRKDWRSLGGRPWFRCTGAVFCCFQNSRKFCASAPGGSSRKLIVVGSRTLQMCKSLLLNKNLCNTSFSKLGLGLT